MSTNNLWELHQHVLNVLGRKLENEQQKLKNQLNELGRKFGGSPRAIPHHRSYPKVEPKS